MAFNRLSPMGCFRKGTPIGLFVVFIVLAFVYLSLRSNNESFDSEAVAEELRSNTENITAFDSLFPKVQWDAICHLEPYDTVVKALRRHHVGEFGNYRIRPNYPIPEDANGLILIDNSKREIYLLLIPLSEDTSNIYKFSGPVCLERPEAFFKVQIVHARNFSYKELIFIKSR